LGLNQNKQEEHLLASHRLKMKIYQRHKHFFLFMALLGLIMSLSLACSLSGIGSGTSSKNKETLFNGVIYIREVRTEPRDMVIHVVKINVALGGIRPHVTLPDNPQSDKPYNARTTSKYLKSSGVQLAINGSGFKPWYDLGIVYSPHAGDPVAPIGTTISGDFSYKVNGSEERPVLAFESGRPVEISWVAGNAKYAVSGTRLLADNGAVLEGLDSSDADPRTAVGMSEDGHHLIIVVVDGRQLGYSQGATLQELAQILVDYGAHRAMELDGGGSSTLVIEDSNGQPKVLNSPVHQGSNGKERPVATHIGFFIQK
jgi:hypothetical protein